MGDPLLRKSAFKYAHEVATAKINKAERLMRRVIGSNLLADVMRTSFDVEAHVERNLDFIYKIADAPNLESIDVVIEDAS